MFKDALVHWVEYKDKESWDKIFIRVYECCIAICKSKAYGINIPRLDEKALDAATYVCDLINRGNRPSGKLVTFCALQCNKFLYDEKLQHSEREVQLSAIEDDRFIEENRLINIEEENEYW